MRRGHQVMVFVHARKDTVRTAQALRDLAIKAGCDQDFCCQHAEEDKDREAYERFGKEVRA